MCCRPIVAVGVYLGLLVLSTAGRDSTVAAAPDQTQVVFAAGESASMLEAPRESLFGVSLEGGQPARLGELVGSNPQAQPGGTLLAFIGPSRKKQDVFVVATDGSGAKNVSNLDTQCSGLAWSRDGRRLAFLARVGEKNDDIYVVDADGGNLRNVSNSPDDESSPQWGPGSRWLAFRFKSPKSDSYRLAIWTPANGVSVLWDKDSVSAFSASPREDKIAFLAGRKNARQLYLVDVRTKEAAVVTVGALKPYEVHFAPDGTQIAVAGDGISTLAADGKGLKKIVRDGHSPLWSPDSKRLAYLVAEAVRDDTRGQPGYRMIVPHQWLWGIDASGSNCRRLWDERGDISLFGWTPDSSHVIFSLGKPQMSLSIPATAGAITDQTQVTISFDVSASKLPVRLMSVEFDSSKATQLASMPGISSGCVVQGRPTLAAVAVAERPSSPATKAETPGSGPRPQGDVSAGAAAPAGVGRPSAAAQPAERPESSETAKPPVAAKEQEVWPPAKGIPSRVDWTGVPAKSMRVADIKVHGPYALDYRYWLERPPVILPDGRRVILTHVRATSGAFIESIAILLELPTWKFLSATDLPRTEGLSFGADEQHALAVAGGELRVAAGDYWRDDKQWQTVLDKSWGVGRASWSADGSRVTIACTKGLQAGTAVRLLYTLAPDGTQVQKITSDPGMHGPVFSRDGKRVFASGLWLKPGTREAQAAGVFEIDLATQRTKLLYDQKDLGGSPGDMKLAISPCGTKLAGITRVFPEGWRGDLSATESDIFIANTDGSGFRKMALGEHRPVTVVWSPTGERLVGYCWPKGKEVMVYVLELGKQ